IGLVCFWISYEFLHQSWDLAFPWMTLGNGFSETHQLVQWYEYTGVYGGTFWIWLSNLLLFQTIYTYKLSNKTSKLALRLEGWDAIIVIPIIISITIYNRYTEYVHPSMVVVVQPNIDPYSKYGSMSVDDQLENLIRLSDSIAPANTEFFIWPETAITEMTNEETVRDSRIYRRLGLFLNNYKNGNLISGIESYLFYDTAKTATARPL